MRVWIISVGEPLPCDGENTRLRRMGNLAKYLASEEENYVDWFSVSFDHYKKKQRVKKTTDISIDKRYTLHLIKVNGYKKNVSISRIIHHKIGSKRIFNKLKQMDKLPDIIIASMEPLEISKISVKFAKLKNIPIIVDVRDLWPEIYYEVIPKKLHFLLDLYVKKCSRTLNYTMGGATSIVGLSEGFLDYGLKYAKRSIQKNDKVIPIGYPNYELSQYRNHNEIIREKYGLPEDSFIILFLGNFGNQFNFEPIVESAILLKDYSNIFFVLCGTGIQMENIKELSKGCNVIFTGWIEQDLIKYIATTSSLGIAPYINSMNYTLNTPNKFGEYLSYGLPPLIGVPGLMDKIVSKYECGYSYQNEQDLTRIILDFYNNREKLKVYSKHARELFESTYDEIYTNQSFSELINEILK